MLSANVTVLIPIVLGYQYLKSINSTQIPDSASLKKLIVVVIIASAFIGFLPLTTGLYMTLSPEIQPLLIIGIALYRIITCHLIKYIGFKSGKSLSKKTVICMVLVIDITYEVYSSTLLSGAKSGIALALPPLMDLGGNVGVMAYVWLFPVSHGTQFAFLVSLALREMVEMIASAGVTSIVCSIWYFNKQDFYMIDVVSDEALRNAVLMALFDFVSELTAFVIFDRMIYKVWKVSLFDLGQAYIRSIGETETYFLLSGFTMYMFMFMSYHNGCDYFFNFEWMNAENLAIGINGTLTFCDVMQSEGYSCYSYGYSQYNATTSFP